MNNRVLMLLILLILTSFNIACKDDSGSSNNKNNLKIKKNENIIIDEKTLGKRVNILIPSQILALHDSNLFCDGRTWFFNEKLKPKVKDGILYLNAISSFYTLPEEVNEKPLPPLKGKQVIIFEFEKEVDKHLIFSSDITTSEFKSFESRIDAYKKKKVMIPLPKEGKSINHFKILFEGEGAVIGIKAIYMR
jgi:hypothetical protein